MVAGIDAFKNLPFLGFTTGTQRVEGGQKAAPIETSYTQPVESAGQNPFAGNLVGVNTNIGIGDYQGVQYQAGRKLGGTTLAFA